MRREEHIDFFLIPDGQLAIHEALENWARWVRVRPHGWQVSPMFRQYRPEKPTTSWWDRREPRAEVDLPAAVEMEKAVSLLPEKHRAAIRWAYYFTFLPNQVAKASGYAAGPVAMARILGVSKQGLADLVSVGRVMLRNRS